MKTFPKAITRQAFIEWLWSKPLDGVVGTSGDSECCPLANFVQDRLGEKASVCADSIWLWNRWDNHDYAATPPWFKDFVTQVDERGGQVSARTALTILGEMA